LVHRQQAWDEMLSFCKSSSRVFPFMAVLMIAKLTATHNNQPSGWDQISHLCSSSVAEQDHACFEREHLLVRQIFAAHPSAEPCMPQR
jgi:hypothetical protein